MFKNGMRPVHAGEVLREEYLIPLGMSATALAKALGVTPHALTTLCGSGVALQPIPLCVWLVILVVVQSFG